MAECADELYLCGGRLVHRQRVEILGAHGEAELVMQRDAHRHLELLLAVLHLLFEQEVDREQISDLDFGRRVDVLERNPEELELLELDVWEDKDVALDLP